jgi:hypothetical protein
LQHLAEKEKSKQKETEKTEDKKTVISLCLALFTPVLFELARHLETVNLLLVGLSLIE